jgi:hypothetical protein
MDNSMPVMVADIKRPGRKRWSFSQDRHETILYVLEQRVHSRIQR